MKSLYQYLLPLLLAGLLTACGFHLRDAESVGVPVENLYLDTSGGGQVGREVQEQLRLTDVNLTSSAKDSEYIVRINRENFQRQVLSVSPRTGKVEEYELVVSVDLSISSSDGRELITNERLSARRDHPFDETAVLATGEEQQIIREELTRLLASQALLRVQATIRNDQEAAAASSNSDS